MSHLQNRLLAHLNPDIVRALEPHFKIQPMKLGEVLGSAGETVTRAYFPQSGVISLVVELSAGSMIETAMIGRDGVLNGASALDGNIHHNTSIVQLDGICSTIPVDVLRKVAFANDPLRSLLIRHEQVVMAESQQAAACNASHTVESRMCRWLLRMRDLADGDDLALTQEFLAQMLGVRRPSVSVVAHTLQKAGLIRYRRGHIRLLDVAGIEEASCECYPVVREHYRQMFV